MKCVFVFTALFGALLAADSEQVFYNHASNNIQMFKAALKKYRGEGEYQRLVKRSDASKKELAARLAEFEDAVVVVNDCNDNKNTKYTAHLNFISVMTKGEKAAMMNLDKMNISSLVTKRSSEPVLRAKRQNPESVNWRARMKNPPVKNQGSCGSCWAFGAVNSLEGRYFALTGENVQFSEQEYLDCTMEHFYEKYKQSWAEDHSGCSGGWMHWAYDYNMDRKRMAKMEDFKYMAEDRGCNMEGVANGMTKADVTGIQWYRGSDDMLERGVVEGIVTVAIKVVSDFNYYREGIFECSGDCDCAGNPNHAVTVTGYRENYWEVRNSWGERWGDGGYIKMSRDQSNICGINGWAQAPQLTCKAGQTCDGWDNGDEEKEEEKEKEEEEKEEEEKKFNIGKKVMCGEIKHFGGLCVDMDDTKNQTAVLTSAGCDRSFCYTSKGYLQDQATKKCLTVSSPSTPDDKVRFGACKSAYTWKTTEKGFRVNADSGFCWHPQGGLEKPAEDTNVVIWEGCDEDRLTFQIRRVLCWEQFAGSKMTKPMTDEEGKKIKTKKLKNAMDMCMELRDKGCLGLTGNGKNYKLCSGKKPKASKKSTDSAYQVVPCDEACPAGKMRCPDKECRESCSEKEEEEKDGSECPGGTTRCSDGICRHEHMCKH